MGQGMVPSPSYHITTPRMSDSDYNAFLREVANARAQQAKKEEDERIRARRAVLERQERQRQEERERQQRIQRQIEQQRLMNKRQEEEKKRQILREEELKKSTEKITKLAEDFKSVPMTQDPFLQYKKLNAVETIQAIGRNVIECSVTGEIVKERVNEISRDLHETLNDDYDLIKSEIKRYQKYGDEMSSMTGVFIEEFNYKPEDTIINDTIEYQNMSNEADDDDEKQLYAQQVQTNLGLLTDAIKNVESKLFMMDQYYDQMITDYGYFVQFCMDKENELDSATSTFSEQANVIRKEKRNQMLGQSVADQQQTTFRERYQKRTTHEKKGCDVDGSIFGAIVRVFTGPKLVGYGLPNETFTDEEVVVKGDLLTDDGSKQAQAMDEIMKKIQPQITEIKNKLRENRQSADEKIGEMERLKNETVKIAQKVGGYKKEMIQFNRLLKSCQIIGDTQRKLIDKRWKVVCAEIQTMVKTMKSN